ncbi:glycosyl transferase [Sulfolobus sp. A20]|uniref:glycosyltransferase family 4 protein n=1 Tax=Saccharolobus sp. A20 TaxID=1891280 RepID=UPI000845CD04|nr:glycosyltransferase [Sulfolobus sp. A20]TRM74048.1 glycosyltransferase family 1 protein [Sulfolobus sp. E5]TRM83558.1 glycosyltransferase family 1 protein [Sulfolobus sp. A20-N-F6]TRM86719.1 glycosyltransferase family 1 protein [Sulfolobus sp. C3]TRN02221.1 glycosyltransferase family 1 protein [Sulfolobus sp. F1]TRN03904.1 glycosyltransferase family 1 protein [Sulfolobus sp. E1]
MAVEEARRLGKLFVLRESFHDYGLTDVKVEIVRKGHGKLTPIFWAITSLYAKGRGKEATVDLDLILTKWLKVSPPALYHDQFAGIMGYLNKVFRGQDYALYLHETNLRAKGVKWYFPRLLDREVMSKAKVVFTNSKENQKVLAEYGFSSVVVYPGCYPRDGKKEREPIVLAVSMWDKGRFPEWYGEVAKRLKRGKLIMAGSWAVKEEKERFKKEYPQVAVTGRLSEEKLQELYDRASIVLRFGFNELGPGMGIIEGICNGLIPIVNEGLGSKELIVNDVNGYVVKDYEEAAEKINYLFENDDRLNKMREELRSLADDLSWDNHARKIREELEKVGML